MRAVTDPIMDELRSAAEEADKAEAAIARLRTAIVAALKSGKYSQADIARAAHREPERIRQIRAEEGLPPGRPGRKPRRRPPTDSE